MSQVFEKLREVQYSPPRRGGVAAPVIKSSEATEAAQTGWSDRRAHVFAELTTPAAPYRNGNFFLMVRPPLLSEEGNVRNPTCLVGLRPGLARVCLRSPLPHGEPLTSCQPPSSAFTRECV